MRILGMRGWLVVLLILSGRASAAEVKLSTAPLTFLDGKTISVEIVMTPKDREVGLMYRKSLPKNYGMLFVFPAQQRLEFWMKNTWVDLDMVFINREKRIAEVYRDVPRSYPETAEKDLARRGAMGQYVLELPRGAAGRHHLKKGQQLKFNAPIPLF